jgi:hypothetical protein
VASYLIRRTFQGVFTLWVIWSLVFVAYFVAPGDPAIDPRVTLTRGDVAASRR